MTPPRLPEGSFVGRADLQRLLAVLDVDGEAAMVVGGAVRNALIGLEPGDIDVATTATPKEVTRRVRAAGLRAIPTGIEHGTVTVVVDGTPFEVTTLREDVETDGRRAVVVFGRDFAHDARRRDFTMNALYADRAGRITDHVGGLADLAARRVRFIGDPQTRIREDYLRILRLFRFHADYGAGALDPPAVQAAVRMREGLARLSRERIGAEWLKLLASRRAAETVAEVAETGFADRILAGVADTRAFARLAAGWPGASPMARLAALAVRTGEDAARLRDRLRLSNAQSVHLERVGRALETLHGAPATDLARRVRRIARASGDEAARDAVAVLAARRGDDPAVIVDGLAADIAAGAAPPPFAGADLAARGVPPGPEMGRALAAATQAWLDAGCPGDRALLDSVLNRAAAAVAGRPDGGSETPFRRHAALD